MSLTIPSLADDAVSAPAPSTKDLKALNKIVDDQKIAKTQTAPIVNISGYADTSYTKVLTGSGARTTCPKSSSSLITEKVSLNMTTADKNNTWFGGVQIDVIHCSSK